MSNSKEKAYDLVDKFYQRLSSPIATVKDWDYDNWNEAKQCAIIVVEEILFALKYDMNEPTSGSIKYWQEVKKEIEKL
jgi:hypothetical protein